MLRNSTPRPPKPAHVPQNPTQKQTPNPKNWPPTHKTRTPAPKPDRTPEPQIPTPPPTPDPKTRPQNPTPKTRHPKPRAPNPEPRPVSLSYIFSSYFSYILCLFCLNVCSPYHSCSNQYLIDHSSILNRKEHEYWRIIKKSTFSLHPVKLIYLFIKTIDLNHFSVKESTKASAFDHI